MAKFGMSLCVLGMAGEFRRRASRVNALWPRTVIATAAVQNLLGGDEVMKGSRKPEIMADAAYAILTRPARECTGNFFIDDEVLTVGGRDEPRQVPERAGVGAHPRLLRVAANAVDDTEKKRLRREVLDDVGALLFEHLAAQEWGRVLVEVTTDGAGQPVVAEMEVEDVVGDEARIDAAFAHEPTVRPLLPVLAKAVEALCGLEDVELERVAGATFLRQPGGSFEWLPGLVHMPSAALERAWDEVTASLKGKQAALEDRFGLGTFEGYDLDLERERIAFRGKGRAGVAGRATLVGSFSFASRSWAWGAHNPNLPPHVRAASAALIDGIVERDMWELTTPIFGTDEATAWALCAFVCAEADGQGVYRAKNGESAVFVMLRELGV